MFIEADIVAEVFDKIEKKLILFAWNTIIIDAEEASCGIVEVNFE